MATKNKSWKEKLLDSKDLPKLVTIAPRMEKKFGKGTMVIPSPIEIDAEMKKVPKGKIITTNKIREKIAKKHGANMACALVTGIFSWIAAHAAIEDELAGKKKCTPYWRTLKSGGIINEKYPGGIEKQAQLLEAEGHCVIQKGKTWIVSDWEKSLVK